MSLVVGSGRSCGRRGAGDLRRGLERTHTHSWDRIACQRSSVCRQRSPHSVGASAARVPLRRSPYPRPRWQAPGRPSCPARATQLAHSWWTPVDYRDTRDTCSARDAGSSRPALGRHFFGTTTFPRPRDSRRRRTCAPRDGVRSARRSGSHAAVRERGASRPHAQEPRGRPRRRCRRDPPLGSPVRSCGRRGWEHR